MEAIDPALGCRGFTAGGTAAGIKKGDMPDLGMIACPDGAAVAGVFTRNTVRAAPVVLDERRAARGVCRGVIANSGNANCCTGEQGIQDARAMAAIAGKALGVNDREMLVASTGVIGQMLDVSKIESAMPALAASLAADGFPAFSRAIMTTDTFPKAEARRVSVGGDSFTVLGVAKGAGMIQPNMATMLCFVCTDIRASSEELSGVLAPGVDASFNRISVDGDMSTNDTVLLMAAGKSSLDFGSNRDAFTDALNDVLLSLARAMVRDGEGATKVVTVEVAGAASGDDANTVAYQIANSPLVKTAFYGEDANWGRLIAAAGSTGVPMNPERFDVYFDDVQVAKNGLAVPGIEAAATTVFKKPEYTVRLVMHMGDGEASVLTCDLSHEYVSINADYRT
ncbi:MAG: bifunctional glutamate N-acetyltransferase/amino-acid acetyltransferase ArgJ [Desulfatibacillaceae bacterium]